MLPRRSPKQLIPTKPVVPASARRRGGRIAICAIDCNLGKITDISGTGMKIRTRKRVPKPGMPFMTTLVSADVAVNVACVVKWVKRAGILAKEVGIEFLQLTPEAQRGIMQLSQAGANYELKQIDPLAGRQA